jgi:hypothetical protein
MEVNNLQVKLRGNVLTHAGSPASGDRGALN